MNISRTGMMSKKVSDVCPIKGDRGAGRLPYQYGAFRRYLTPDLSARHFFASIDT